MSVSFLYCTIPIPILFHLLRCLCLYSSFHPRVFFISFATSNLCWFRFNVVSFLADDDNRNDDDDDDDDVDDEEIGVGE